MQYDQSKVGCIVQKLKKIWRTVIENRRETNRPAASDSHLHNNEEKSTRSDHFRDQTHTIQHGNNVQEATDTFEDGQESPN